MVSNRLKITGVIAAASIILVVAGTLMFGLGKNDDQNYQVFQSVTGKVTIIDNPGWYVKAFATVWTYPRSEQQFFSADPTEGSPKDESVRVTFNDGGTAQVSSMVRFQTPIKEDDRRKAHRDFSGSTENMISAVRAHLINCMKSTAPLMSASEHQSARKAEFAQLVEEQLRNGLYKTRKVERKLLDQTDEEGKPITVFATEIVTDKDGLPVIASKSPLEEYGISILQFSVTGTDYDQMTRQQFEAKKKSFLAAEQSKAEREQEVQQRLMVTEKGLREKAEIEAKANVEKAEAVIKAQKEKEVAETEASKRVEVAKLEKEEAETKALMALEVAKLAKQEATEKAEAVRILAEAEEERIQKAGALTEFQEALLKATVERDAKVAEHLSKIAVPASVIISGDQGGNSDGGQKLTQNLINLNLLKSLGILGDQKGKLAPMIVPDAAGTNFQPAVIK